jgi:hypothetical protein
MTRDTLSGAPRARTVAIRRSAASAGATLDQLRRQLLAFDDPGQSVAGEQEQVAGLRLAAHSVAVERFGHSSGTEARVAMT